VDAIEAIRRRRSVRRYTDRPVADADVDEVLRLALLAPTGSMAQAWTFLVVREPERARAVGELVIEGGGRYFAMVRPSEGRAPEEQSAWGREYAETALGSYRHVPVWIVAVVVPRPVFPRGEESDDWNRVADLTSISFAMENLFVAARAKGLGTVPTVFHWFVDDRFRELLGVPDDLEIPLITPLGYPVEFPESLPPALKAIRRPWRTLVHDERWGNARRARAAAG
jgi:nitroreductase